MRKKRQHQPDYFISGPDDVTFHLAEDPASASEEPSAEEVAAMRRAIFGEGYLDVPARAEEARQNLKRIEHETVREVLKRLDDGEEIALLHETAREVLKRLDDHDRVIFLLRYLYQTTDEDIADILSVSVERIRLHLHNTIRNAIQQVSTRSKEMKVRF